MPAPSRRARSASAARRDDTGLAVSSGNGTMRKWPRQRFGERRLRASGPAADHPVGRQDDQPGIVRRHQVHQDEVVESVAPPRPSVLGSWSRRSFRKVSAVSYRWWPSAITTGRSRSAARRVATSGGACHQPQPVTDSLVVHQADRRIRIHIPIEKGADRRVRARVESEDGLQIGGAGAHELQSVIFVAGKGALVGKDHLLGVLVKPDQRQQPAPPQAGRLARRELLFVQIDRRRRVATEDPVAPPRRIGRGGAARTGCRPARLASRAWPRPTGRHCAGAGRSTDPGPRAR